MTCSNILKENLCIGCGACSAACPSGAIQMRWTDNGIFEPVIDSNKCTDCGLCIRTCPNSPKCLLEYAGKAACHRETIGLTGAKCYLAHVAELEERKRSASGGALTALLKSLLESGKVDGVISSVPILSKIGDAHYEVRILRAPEEIDAARSSHYYPACYDKVLREIGNGEGSYALVGVPCIIRAIERLPDNIRAKIKYTFGLVCSHNVSGTFVDCLARQHGVSLDEKFKAYLRDKKGNTAGAGNYNTHFSLEGRDIRTNRFRNAFTAMWRNYFFALEGCLYCPDFYAMDADLSVKDAWGLFSKDPMGSSMLIVRNSEIEAVLTDLEKSGVLSARRCGPGEVLRSQPETPVFKQIGSINRMRSKKFLRKEIGNSLPCPSAVKKVRVKNAVEYAHMRIMIFLSRAFYPFWPEKVAKIAGTFSNYCAKGLILFSKVIYLGFKVIKGLFSPISYIVFNKFRYSDEQTLEGKEKGPLNIVILGGYGYRNVGDEAQLSTVIRNWRSFSPEVEINVLSPEPEYTNRLHKEKSSLAPRAVLFESRDNGNYVGSNILFKWRYKWIRPRILRFAALLKAGKSLKGAHPEEVELLRTIAHADVLHFAGGGYLTGMTLSRLWDGMLVMKVADIFSTPLILSGQTIGVFKDNYSKKVAKEGFSLADAVYLRDPEGSKKDLERIGITGEKVQITFDDALFCDIANKEEIEECLLDNGICPEAPYVVVNVHYFNQGRSFSAQCMTRMAEICDNIVREKGMQIVFLPLTPSDSRAIEEVRRKMSSDSRAIDYDFDYRIAKGVISTSSLMLTMKHHGIIFAMGAVVPTIAIALDDYYIRKNRGALNLFTQGRLLLNEDSLFASGRAEEMITEVLDSANEIRLEIRGCLDEMRPRDGEVIKGFLLASKGKG